MAKAPSKRPTKPKGPPPPTAEALAAEKARLAFVEAARARGEVATAADAEPLSGAAGTLYTEDTPGRLTRHRFSLLPPPLPPPSLFPPAEPSGTD